MGIFDFFKKQPPKPKPMPENDPELVAILETLKGVKRPTWVPQVTPGDGDPLASKFSGIPWIAANEDWPVCPNCNNPMQLFVQLNLAELPDRPAGCPSTGLVQFFYCVSREPYCEGDCEAYAPGSRSVVVRIVQPEGPGRRFDSSPVPDAFPPRLITGWTQRDDYPSYEEIGDLVEGFNIDLYDTLIEGYEMDIPAIGEKLMGWPHWIQGSEYPDCPDCGTRMHLLFQVDSEVNVPYMFGDAGIGHLTQCPNHPHRLYFAWACC